MDLKKIHNVYFIGIGGIGMSALARYFKFINKKVAGYDKTETPLTDELSDLGMAIHYEDNLSLVPEDFLNKSNTLVVYTPAVPLDHTEYQFFLKSGFSIKETIRSFGTDYRKYLLFGSRGNPWQNNDLLHLGPPAQRNRHSLDRFSRGNFRRFQ